MIFQICVKFDTKFGVLRVISALRVQLFLLMTNKEHTVSGF